MNLMITTDRVLLTMNLNTCQYPLVGNFIIHIHKHAVFYTMKVTLTF